MTTRITGTICTGGISRQIDDSLERHGRVYKIESGGMSEAELFVHDFSQPYAICKLERNPFHRESNLTTLINGEDCKPENFGEFHVSEGQKFTIEAQGGSLDVEWVPGKSTEIR